MKLKDILLNSIVNKDNCTIEEVFSPSCIRPVGARPDTLTIDEVRLANRDTSAEDNFLLDDVEYTDTEIAWAIHRPIDQWNETSPIMRRYCYTVLNFPYRYNWLTAVKGELMIMAAANYRRNHLPYQAAGVSVDDKNKYDQYEKIGRALLQEWKEWMLTTKRSLNVQQAFGHSSLRSYGP